MKAIVILFGVLLVPAGWSQPAVPASDAPSAAKVVMPPLPPSPIEEFRKLLKMDREEQDTILAQWPETKRTVLRQKIKQYAALPENERERRLQMLEMRHYLPPLMKASPENRARQMEMVPEHLREPLQARLNRWDRVPEQVRERAVENDMTIHYFARPEAPPMPPAEGGMTFGKKKEIHGRFEKLRNVPAEDRPELSRNLTRLFAMPAEERSRVLQVLPEEERQEIQRTLDMVMQMEPEQRQVCIQSFARLAKMPPEERQLFLRSASRWHAMTQEERDSWKRLVQTLPPFPSTTIMPPMPPGNSQATNPGG